MYSGWLQTDVLPFRYLLTYVLLYSIFINYHSWRDSLKETINKPISVKKCKREWTFRSHEEQKNVFWQSWHLISVFYSKQIWQWSGGRRLSQLRRASSSSVLLLCQLDDKCTLLVSQFLDGIFVELRNSSHLAKAALRLSVEQYSYLC